MSTVCIIGAGDLGGAIAHALAQRESVRRVVLIDDAAAVAVGKALDLQQAGAIQGSHTQLSGSADLSLAIGASVCVIANRAGKPGLEWQDEEGLSVVRRLTRYLGEAPLVFAGTSMGGLLAASARELHVPRERLIGSASTAVLGAVKSIVALEARCSPTEIDVALAGVPPEGLVIPWGEASIGGHALEQMLSPVQLARAERRIAHAWPPGPFALGLAAALVVEALVSTSRRRFSVLTVLGGEFGVRGRVGVLTARLSTRGIAETIVPALSLRERVKVENALGG